MLQALDSLPNSVYWSAPADLDSDFTAEDPLALDYLGQQVGLWLFPGFTTRTGRAQNYAMVLYGLHLAGRACERYGVPASDDARTEFFQRWERFWALATLEANGGPLSRGDSDAMRGVRGATRAWFEGDRPLPLDFPLISRQSELGSLGAYLSSLRTYGLVFAGTLRPTPAAKAIIDAFWDEPDENQAVPQYEDYALAALDTSKLKIGRKHGRITLRKAGKMSRLSSLTRRQRVKQQDRLWRALFLNAHDDSTLALSHQLIAAADDEALDAEALLEGMEAGRWGALPAALREKVHAAVVFGRLAQELLSRFNRAYEHVHSAGWVCGAGDAARAAFPAEEAASLAAACGAVLEAPGSKAFGKLQFHGKPMLRLLAELPGASSTTALDRLLRYHRAVQRSRRGGGAWLRQQDDKLLLQVTSYNGYKSEAQFPGFKLSVVERLLHDLGRVG
ncbi:MAG: hypothetical protein ACE37F_35480 [Nannocystaceae bacterium]|nr:hypothetical protein [bacterium]